MANSVTDFGISDVIEIMGFPFTITFCLDLYSMELVEIKEPFGCLESESEKWTVKNERERKI